MARRLTLLGCALSIVACSAAPVDPPMAGRTRPVDGPPPTADYEVHEWGLVRQEAGSDALQFSGVAPPVPGRPMVVLKPVLYFHADAPLVLDSVTVTSPAGGSILEVWPLLNNGRRGVQIGGRVEWNHVEIDPEEHSASAPKALDPAAPPARTCDVSPLPTASDPPCTALGNDFCEVAGLAVARTNASCVRANGTTERFLFYRGRTTTLRPPIVLERAKDEGTIVVTNSGPARIPGRMIRIRTEGWESFASVFDPPEPGASVKVAAPTSALPLDAAKSAIGEAMGVLGLRADEIRAFHAAWDATLFPMPAGGEVQLDMPATGLSGIKPSESILYFLPHEATDGVAKLDFSPAPTVVHRAIAVWAGIP